MKLVFLSSRRYNRRERLGGGGEKDERQRSKIQRQSLCKPPLQTQHVEGSNRFIHYYVTKTQRPDKDNYDTGFACLDFNKECWC
jgi:hypothetical protein